MNKHARISKKMVTVSRMTRRRAEKISSIEGLELSVSLQGFFQSFDRERLSGQERRERIKAHFHKKTA